MAALPYDELGTPMAQAFTMIERLERLAQAGELTPERHLAILHRLALLETEFKLLRPYGPSDWPETAVADYGIALAVQACLAKFGGLDAATFDRSIAKLRLALHQLSLWSAGIRAFPSAEPVAAPVRRVGRFSVIQGGRA